MGEAQSLRAKLRADAEGKMSLSFVDDLQAQVRSWKRKSWRRKPPEGRRRRPIGALHLKALIEDLRGSEKIPRQDIGDRESGGGDWLREASEADKKRAPAVTPPVLRSDDATAGIQPFGETIRVVAVVQTRTRPSQTRTPSSARLESLSRKCAGAAVMAPSPSG